MLNYKTIRSRGFHPRHCGSPDAINPKQVIHHYPEKRRGGIGGQALSPPSSYLHLEFHINGKGILQSK